MRLTLGACDALYGLVIRGEKFKEGQQKICVRHALYLRTQSIASLSKLMQHAIKRLLRTMGWLWWQGVTWLARSLYSSSKSRLEKHLRFPQFWSGDMSFLGARSRNRFGRNNWKKSCKTPNFHRIHSNQLNPLRTKSTCSWSCYYTVPWLSMLSTEVSSSAVSSLSSWATRMKFALRQRLRWEWRIRSWYCWSIEFCSAIYLLSHWWSVGVSCIAICSQNPVKKGCFTTLLLSHGWGVQASWIAICLEDPGESGLHKANPACLVRGDDSYLEALPVSSKSERSYDVICLYPWFSNEGYVEGLQ